MLKREGYAPERVVVAIKELARTAIMPGLLARHERAPGKIAREEITGLMVRCCIEAYYDEMPSARAAHTGWSDLATRPCAICLRA
jgi:hypothetical protein